MDIIGRLATIQESFQAVENEKEQMQQTLAAFWKHLPPIDHALGLEDRKRAFFQEQEDLIMGDVIRGRQGD
ncbi:hypothetical protein A4A49_54235 [Nicotiana attenuata]|uniref:Uncharacterized protein n=1 Tax=Nicotiana attenuata TaxID=49451 RepID=A0A314KZ17_NICAT|nr:hypothetical protein A4A49_54235 [Nicotiana attenuata]